jgi:acyl-CoA thioester hydrolase
VSTNLLTGFPVVIELPVVWGEMDSYGHVNNVVYIRYLESARVEYLRRLDWVNLQNATGIGPILASISCRFRKPLFYPDTIQVGARITSVGADRFTIDHRIVSRALGSVAAEGQGMVVSFDYKKQTKAPLPEEIRQRIAEIERGGQGEPAQEITS